RKRKEKSERRLDATEGSLLRVQDLLREVRRQLRPLERQADAARRHGDLVSELNALRTFLIGREIAAFRGRLEALSGSRTDGARREEEIRRSLAGLDTSILAAEAELSARGDSGLSDELVRVEQLRERARGISMLLVERRRSYERDRGHLMDAGVVASLEADAANLRQELAEVLDKSERLHPELAELSEEEAAFETERSAAVTLFDQISPTTSAASAAAEVRGELRSLRASVEGSESELRRHQSRHDMLEDRLRRLDEDAERFRQECERAQDVELPLVGEVTDAEAARLEAEAACDRATDAHAAATSDLARWQARAEALQLALDSARSRAGAEHLRDVDGVIGTLLDLIVIDDGWEASVEAALGEELVAVIVKDATTARSALRRLRESASSGAVIALGSRADVVVASLVPAGGQRIRDHVRAERSDVSTLLDLLLTNAVRVPDWTAAVDSVLADPRLVAVTADGDRFSTTGWRIGVSGGGATAAALEDAVRGVERAVSETARTADDLSRAQTRREVARERESAVQRQLDANDAAFTAASEALARVQGERRETISELDGLVPTLGELIERLGRLQGRVRELEDLVPGLEREEAAEAAAAQARGEARATLDAKAALLAGRRRDLEVRKAGLLERRDLIESRLSEVEHRLEADAGARAAAATQRERLETLLQATERLGSIVESHRQTVEARLAELHDVRRRQSDEVRAL
ncbi:MAG: hypothetical protein ACKOBT_05210, partial [Actinomycetota bacterium]